MDKKLAVVVMGMVIACAARVHAAQYATANLVNELGLAATNSYVLNVATFPNAPGGISRLTAQIIYSSMSPTTDTFTSGSLSTASITVVSTQSLVAQYATNFVTVPATSLILAEPATAQIKVNLNTGLGAGATSQLTVLTTSSITGLTIFINGATSVGLAQGVQWAIGSSTSTTADNIVAAINAVSEFTNIVATHPVQALQGVIFATSTVFGSRAFGYTITSTSMTALSTTTFSGGTEGAVLNINGNLLRNGIEWQSGVTSTDTAASIATAINTRLTSTLIANTTSGLVVWTTATVAGSAFNNTVILSSPSASLTPSATFYTGGSDPVLRNATLSFNGNVGRNGVDWTDASGLSTGTAKSIAFWLNSFGVVVATAPDGSSTVFSTATVPNFASNLFTLASNNTKFVIGGPTYAGGNDNAVLTINGTSLTASSWTQTANSFFVIGTTKTTSINLSTAIVNNSTLNKIITSTETANSATYGIVFATSIITGLNTNFSITSSTGGLRVPASGAFFGGTTSSSTINSAVLTIPNHGYTNGLAVVYSSNSAVQLKPLLFQTSYFVLVIDANNIALATSLNNEIAGSTITITSSSTLVTAPTFTLTPIAITGTPSWKWQVSNDGTNWTDLTTPATYTVGGFVFPSTSTVVDFGDVDYQQLRMSITTPTAGALKIKVPVNGRL